MYAVGLLVNIINNYYIIYYILVLTITIFYCTSYIMNQYHYNESIKHSQRTNKHYHDENMSNM